MFLSDFIKHTSDEESQQSRQGERNRKRQGEAGVCAARDPDVGVCVTLCGGKRESKGKAR